MNLVGRRWAIQVFREAGSRSEDRWNLRRRSVRVLEGAPVGHRRLAPGEDRSVPRSGSLGGPIVAAVLGSARETGACIDVAQALGYVEDVEPLLLDEPDQVRAILVRVTR